MSGRTAWRRRRWGLFATGLGAAAACAEIGTGPNDAAAIEMEPFPSPSVVIGDTLRNINGVVAPVRAIVRNVRGDVIDDAPIRYLYAEFNRDSALRVDSATGIVVALRASSGADPRVAARVGGSLQVLRALVVTQRPDTVIAQPSPALLTTVFPDTGRFQATSNATQALSVGIRTRTNDALANVNAWPVRFELVAPANPTNDTNAVAFLVDDSGRPSTLDTSDVGGTAGRRVRVRAQRFPTGAAVETVIVRAVITYKGQPVAGSPLLLTGTVRRGTP